MSAPSSECDVVVIGAGPAGSVAAAALQRAGLRVQVFEATQFPRFVIGESLLPRCMDILEATGLLEPAMRQGYLRKEGAIFLWGGTRAQFDFADQHTKGWSYTWQVPRAHFDDVLARAVADQGVSVFFEHSVQAVDVGEAPSVDVADVAGKVHHVRCRFIVDASGYGRVLPRLLGLDRPSAFPPRKACFTHVKGDRLPPGADGGRIWVVSNRQDAWTWVIPFSDGTTSVGLVGAPEYFEQFSGTPEEVLRAVLSSNDATHDRLRDFEVVFPVRQITAYSKAVARTFGPGYCLVGNATEFLDPVFSSGVCLAMESGYRAASVLARQLGGQSVDWQTDYADYMARGVDTFRTYVEAWYDGRLPTIFRAPNPAPSIKRMICSVLAGYVWDGSNPFVAQHAEKVDQLVTMLV